MKLPLVCGPCHGLAPLARTTDGLPAALSYSTAIFFLLRQKGCPVLGGLSLSLTVLSGVLRFRGSFSVSPRLFPLSAQVTRVLTLGEIKTGPPPCHSQNPYSHSPDARPSGCEQVQHTRVLLPPLQMRLGFPPGNLGLLGTFYPHGPGSPCMFPCLKPTFRHGPSSFPRTFS